MTPKYDSGFAGNWNSQVTPRDIANNKIHILVYTLCVEMYVRALWIDSHYESICWGDPYEVEEEEKNEIIFYNNR